MADAIRTRCKFRVVGVEDTEHVIFEAIYMDTSSEFNAIEGEIWSDHESRKYRNKIVGRAQNVRLAASYDSSNSEDVSFAAATPSGEVKIYVSNPKVIGTFTPGKNYYLDLIPCE